MTLEPYKDEMTRLSDRLATFYGEIMVMHADDPAVGACLICKVSKCTDWRSAVERLICAGERPTMPVAVAPATKEEPT